MSNIASSVTSYVLGLLTSETGVDSRMGGGDSATTIRAQNASPELLERALQVTYPTIYVYCDKLDNTLQEKFTSFSGKVRLVIDIRCSRDRLDGLEQELSRISDAVCRVLDGARGTWQDGAFFAGAYEITYGAVRHGGKNFLQIAKVILDVQVTR